MNDLVIKITGTVQDSNFGEWKEAALSEIKSANKTLVTDDDFAEAEETVKKCKKAEITIANAKQSALHQTVDISKLFTDLDELSAELAKTRLALEKQIKNEKEQRKNKVVRDGIESIDITFRKILGINTDLSSVLRPDYTRFEQAVKGKKSIMSMIDAVTGEVEAEERRLAAVVAEAKKNLQEIALVEPEYPGLFPDKVNLATKTTGEVVAIIAQRITSFKLAEKEKAERKEKEQEKEQPAPQPAPVQKEIFEATKAQPMENTRYMFTVELLCEKQEAVALAKKVSGMIGNEKCVVSMNLTKQEKKG